MPTYRLVAIDESQRRQGSEVEVLGNYNPHRDPAEINFKADRIQYWLSVGARPSDTVRSLIKKAR